MKGEAMNFTGTMLTEGRPVLGGAIPLVLAEVVTWKLAMVHFHNPVPGYLCNDGGSGDGNAQTVTLDKALLRYGNGDALVPIDKDKVGRDR